MQERLLKVVKIFFIVLGVMFLMIMFLTLALYFGSSNMLNAEPFNANLNIDKSKSIQKIIDYTESYREQNGQYPEVLDGIKIDKNIEYSYKTSENNNCFKVDIKYKKANKTQQYQRCLIKTSNTNSYSESYSEYINR